MREQWIQLSIKFSQLTPREIVLIFVSGLVVLFMVPFSLSIEHDLKDIKKADSQITKLTRSNIDLNTNIQELSKALKADPNKALKLQINDYEQRLKVVDDQLLALTEELIDPIEMRKALIKLLRLQKGVSLVDFHVLPAEPLVFSKPKAETIEETDKQTDKADANNDEQQVSLGLYRHGIEITLTGKYFQLRDYLQQLENLPWKFYWHDFHYQLMEYPKSELKIEIYSLSTNQEFIGV